MGKRNLPGTMRFLKRFWPWKRIAELEEQLRQERNRHEGHMRKLATIIAVKGGFGLLLVGAFVAQGQGVIRNNVTTNIVGIAPADGWFIISSNGVPVWAVNALSLTNFNQLWTNDLNGANQVLRNTDISQNLGWIDFGAGTVAFSTIGGYSTPLPINSVMIGNTFVPGPVVSGVTLIGNSAGLVLTNGDGTTAYGESALGNAAFARNCVGIGENAGGNVLLGDNSIFIGNNSGPTSFPSNPTNRVFIGNSSTDFNVGGNGLGTIAVLGTTNFITFGGTNVAPSGTATPTKWVSVQINGEATKYRIPLYQ